MNPDLSALKTLLETSQSFVILSHIRPDGDAYGTSLALGHLLRALGKTVHVYNEDGMIPLYEFLPDHQLLKKTPVQAPDAETKILAVDTAEIRRLGETFSSWNRIPDLNLDHHISNTRFGKLNHIDAESPASAQVLFEVIEALSLPCPAPVAHLLFVGLTMDTGSFRFRQTTARTFDVAAQLVRHGADPALIAQQCYQNYAPSRLLLQREVLNAVQFTSNQRIARYRLTQEMLQRSGADAEENEGFVESLLAVRTVEASFVLEEISPEVTRASLRSRGNVDVQKIASTFGGGGHRLAAGIRSQLTMNELETRILQAIEAQLP